MKETELVKRRENDVPKPVKKRPKSGGYELFDKEACVIGLVSQSFAYKEN